MWQRELIRMFDKNSDKKISLYELIIGCVPDADNNNIVSEKEFTYGKRTASIWLANIISSVPNALDDNYIDLNEIRQSFNSIKCIPTQTTIRIASGLIDAIQFCPKM